MRNGHQEMNKKVEEVFSFLDNKFPNAHCELYYQKDYELLFAVMLSAQATDKSVNKVTEVLFRQYPTLELISQATEDQIERIIHSVGLSKTKAKNILMTAKTLVSDYNGKVPSDKNELMNLPGVGRKTANVVRIEYFKIPEIPVDTHVERVSKRIGLVKEDCSTLEVENTLKRIIPKERLIKAHHQLIFLGRYLCKSQNPSCKDCGLQNICKHYKKLLK